MHRVKYCCLQFGKNEQIAEMWSLHVCAVSELPMVWFRVRKERTAHELFLISATTFYFSSIFVFRCLCGSTVSIPFVFLVFCAHFLSCTYRTMVDVAHTQYIDDDRKRNTVPTETSRFYLNMRVCVCVAEKKQQQRQQLPLLRNCTGKSV